MTLLTALAGTSYAQSAHDAEVAWWAMLDEVIPGTPGAPEALSRWLSSYSAISPRAPALYALRDCLSSDCSRRDALRLYTLARASWPEVQTRRWSRQVGRLEPRSSGRRFDIDVDWLDDAYAQATIAPFAAEARMTAPDRGLHTGFAGTTHVGLQKDIFDFEGLWLLGAVIDSAYAVEAGDPTVRGELAAAIGGDGLLLFAGAGLSNHLGLHQFGQVQLTNDGDGLWAVLALRLQTEEGLTEDRRFGVRALAQIGFKFGETPD